MDPPSSSSSNTRNYNITNIINNNQDNPLSSFLIPTYTTTPTTTSYIPAYNPNNNIITNPSSTTNPSPSSSSQPPPRGGTSKKRTRASRRAPTTVLSTDTSNFRAMVQEFTGFPSPPFPPSNSSPSIHSFNHLLSRSSFPHNLTTTTFSPSSILHAIASNPTTNTPTYPPNMLMFNNNATPSSINSLTNIHGVSGTHVHGHGHNVASTQFGDLGRVLVGASSNGDQDRCDDDDDNSSTREDKRRKSVLDSWNDHI